MPNEFTAEIADRLRSANRARPVGARTKPALSATPDGITPLEIAGHSGIVEYEPGEFTITARAGTPLRVIASALASNHQYLPFDPLLVEEGATLGGTIAAGTNGPGRLRFGGMRDFILGIVFLTGDGRLVRGGGKVVKNAAGFDFPKLLVGSCGRLGVIVEATFKVFPAPEAVLTARHAAGSVIRALPLVSQLARRPLDLDALEIEADGTITIRLAGDAGTLVPRLDRLNADAGVDFQMAPDDCWARWHSERAIKVPLTPSRIPTLDAALAAADIPRRYSVAGHVVWIASSAPEVGTLLKSTGFAGLALDGPMARLGAWPPRPADSLVAGVLNPGDRLA